MALGDEAHDDGEVDVSQIKADALRRRAQNKTASSVAKYTLALFIIVVVLLILFG